MYNTSVEKYITPFERSIDIEKPIFDQFPELAGLENFDGTSVSISTTIKGTPKQFKVASLKYETKNGSRYVFGLWEADSTGNLAPAGVCDLGIDRKAYISSQKMYAATTLFDNDFSSLFTIYEGKGDDYNAFQIAKKYRDQNLGQTFFSMVLATLEKVGVEKAELSGDLTAGNTSTTKKVTQIPVKDTPTLGFQNQKDYLSGTTLLTIPKLTSFYSKYATDKETLPEFDWAMDNYIGVTKIKTHLSGPQITLLMQALRK